MALNCDQCFNFLICSKYLADETKTNVKIADAHCILITLNGSAATSVVAGDNFTATIIARDASNATFTSFNGYVTLTSSSAIGTGGGLIGPFVGGELTNHTLSLLTAGNNHTITVVNPDDPTAFGSATVGVVAPNVA